MAQRIGGSQNEKLKTTIWKEFRLRSCVYYDGRDGRVKIRHSVDFATVKELRDSLRILREYGPPGK